MKTVERENHIAALRELLPQSGENALDIGCGHHFGIYYEGLQFKRVIAINACESVLRVVRHTYGEALGREYVCLDIANYEPDCQFDLITATHVVEHLGLDSLAVVLNRLVNACRGVFIVETPEQFDSNTRTAVAENNPYEVHHSLVPAEFLARWGFEPVFRYWQNELFSNAVYYLNRS